MAFLDLFNKKIRSIIGKKLESIEDKLTNSLFYIGEKFSRDAKVNGNYTDRTGNLRSSIGYIVQKDGEIINKSFEGAKKEGAKKGENFSEECSESFPKGNVLIGVAGMNYARHVENKNYDVISGSAPTKEEFKSFLEKSLYK